MGYEYYIDIEGIKDGPHDMVTIMRRIRAKKITMETRIFTDDSTTSIPAKDVPDLKIFFGNAPEAQNNSRKKATIFNLSNIIRDGWRFTCDNNIMTVFAGGMVLIAIMLSASMADVLGPEFGIIMSWIIIVMLHYVYFVFCLRLYRGQPISVDYMNNHLAPVLSTLFLAAFSVALMVAGGFILLIIPAIIVMVYYVFVPFLIIDRKMNMVEAMHASRLLVCKFDKRYYRTIFMLVLAYVGSVILIIPVPITLPMFAASLIKMYEEMSYA